jgi:uncharacterized protein (TIGR03503 family)
MAAEPEHADVRVLIDISGSMKQNDPQNLRRPALRMLVGLLQPGTKAGVWTFAKYAGALVQPGPVDRAWKDKALQASEEINSPGMFTNIELVLQKAIHEWEGAKPTHRRHLLLLTDGVVDVSKAPGESEASRERIARELLPKLRDMGVQLHSIALSERADHALLKQLSAGTDGWYEQVDTAEQLQRVFLKLFEKAGKPDGLPLKDNKFLVDNTIREATILLFRPEGAEEPSLLSPSGQTFSHGQAPAFISWHRDTGYDLITLRDPEAGEWSLSAEMDPDNRVMVVTDLKLHISELPSRIVAGEPMSVAAHLSNDGHLITRRDFLDVVEVRAETISEAGLTPQPLNDKGYKGDKTAMDGKYGMDLVERNAQPEVDLIIAAESPTFLREARHVMAVVEPARLDILEQDGALEAVITVDGAVMRLGGVKINLWQQDPDGIRLPLVSSVEGDDIYRGGVVDSSLPVHARIEGLTSLGNRISRELGPVYAAGMSPQPRVQTAEAEPAPQAETESPAEEPAEAMQKAEEPAQQQADKPAKAEKEEKGEEEDSWLLPALGFGVVNLLVIAGGLVFWWLRRRNASDEEFTLVDDDEDEAADSEEAKG